MTEQTNAPEKKPSLENFAFYYGEILAIHEIEKSQMSELKAEFDQREDVKKLTEDMGRTKALLEKLKNRIVTLARSQYDATGNKQLVPGVGIRITRSFEINETSALEWAEKYMPVAIQRTIDRKAIEGYLLKTNPDQFPWAAEIETVTVTVSSDPEKFTGK